MPKNEFAGPNFIQETIITQEGSKIGVIRIKPSTVLWKPSWEQKFYSISLDSFVEWITRPETGAARTRY